MRRSVGGRLWVTEELEQKDPRGASPGMALAIDRSLWARDGAVWYMAHHADLWSSRMVGDASLACGPPVMRG